MKNWKEIVKIWKSKSYPGFDFFLPGPCSVKVLGELKGTWGIDPTDEFKSLYREFNGVGFRDSGLIKWLFVPAEDLPHFKVRITAWFKDSHPQIAERYFPFFDWDTSDSVGFLKSDTGEMLPGLYEFSHEVYEFDSTQSYTDFIFKTSKSIEDFIKS